MDIFGHLPDGAPVGAVEIAGGGLKAVIVSYGSALHDLRLKGHGAPLVLGYGDIRDYLPPSPYLGANCGRSINRIRDGKLVIDGRAHQLDRNYLGKHNLHGGHAGLSARNWTFVAVSKDEAVLEIRCPDGNMGFPGNLDVRATYRLPGKGVLSVTLEAVTDAPTVCNLSHHSYFNLSDGGRGSILEHTLEIIADGYLPVDDELIPDGRVLPVAGTAFDFRKERPIRREAAGRQIAYDLNYCVSAARGPLRHVASARSAASGVTMQCWSGEPGLQFYAGGGMARPSLSPQSFPYDAFAGFCLEAQVWPGFSAYPYFPQAVLRPGEASKQVTEYRFSR
jgi:aldose 1-epimerase